MKALLPSEKCAVVGVIDPDANTASTYQSAWISMSDFQWIMAIVMAGTMGASGTIDAKLEQAQDASGTGVKDVANTDITQLTQAGGDSDAQVVIQCNAEDLDIANDFTHVRLSLTVAAATSDSGAIVLGLDPRYAPASDNDLASVAEIVTA